MRLMKDNINQYLPADVLNNIYLYEGVEYIQVHPTFLYESLWNLIVFSFLLWYRKKKRFNGEVFCMYLIGYGLGRVWIEGLRIDQLKIGATGIAVSQVLSIILVISSILLIIINRKNTREI